MRFRTPEAGSNRRRKKPGSGFYRSDDDGRTWKPVAKIGTVNGNETSLLHLGGGRWLAAQRTYKERALEMFHSCDNGLTWTSQGLLTSKNQHPAHMLRLADKRILLTYADRAKAEKEILTRFSADEGETWGPPQVLATFTDDGGYPSSAQLADEARRMGSGCCTLRIAEAPDAGAQSRGMAERRRWEFSRATARFHPSVPMAQPLESSAKPCRSCSAGSLASSDKYVRYRAQPCALSSNPSCGSSAFTTNHAGRGALINRRRLPHENAAACPAGTIVALTGLR